MMAKPALKHKWYHNVYLRSRLWVQVRADYMRRVGWMCERCFIRKATVVHHLDYSRLGYEQPEDLMALCVECHVYMHRIPKAANDNQPDLPFGRSLFSKRA